MSSESHPQPAPETTPPAPTSPKLRSVALRTRVFLGILLLGTAVWTGLTFQEIDAVKASLDQHTGNLMLEEKSLSTLTDALGYGGFLGAASRFADIQGQAQLDKMRISLDTAEQALMPLTAASYGQANESAIIDEVRAIFELYRAEMNRAEQAFISKSHEAASQQNLLVLANALPELAQRLHTLISGRNTTSLEDMVALEHRLVWLLSVLFATSILSGFFGWRWLERRYSSPLASLSESAARWRRDTLETPPPGRERMDDVGALARELDLLRQHFATLPDLTLPSESGEDPLRVRFEGKSRGLFETLIRQLLEASVTLSKAGDGTAAAHAQTLALTTDLQRTNQNLEATAQIAKDLNETAAKANSEIGTFLGVLNTRVESMTELATLTGTQVTEALRSVRASEMAWRETTDEGQSIIGRFAATADELSERLEAATDLLRASGAVIDQTAEASKARLNEALDVLSKNGATLQALIDGPAQKIEMILMRSLNAADKSETAAHALDDAIAGVRLGASTLSEQLLLATGRFDQIGMRVDSLEQIFSTTIGNLSQKSRELAGLFDTLHVLPAELRETITSEAAAIANVAQSLCGRGDALEATGHELLAQTKRLEETGVNEILDRLSGLNTVAVALGELIARLDHSMPHIADAIARARSPQGISVESIQRLNETLDTSIAATEVNSLKVATMLQSSRDQITAMLERLQRLQESQNPTISIPMAPLKKVPHAKADPVEQQPAQTQSLTASAKPQGRILTRFRKDALSPPPESLSLQQSKIDRIRLAAKALSATASIMMEDAEQADSDSDKKPSTFPI